MYGTLVIYTIMSKWTTYTYDLLSTVPPRSGVYAIFYEEDLVYIGQSENLFKRLRYHEQLPADKRSDSRVKVRMCPKLGESRMIEFRLLRRLRPLLNKKHVVDSGKNKYTYDNGLIEKIHYLVLVRNRSHASTARMLNEAGHRDIRGQLWSELSVGRVLGRKLI